MKKDIRNDFPILKQQMNGCELIYLDNAATSQKPQVVIESLIDFYTIRNANIHRSICTLAEQATQMYEDARGKVASFIGAADPHEIIFVSSATEGINLIANTWGECDVDEGDEIVVTQMEHHSNLVPWQMLAYRKNATLKFIPVLPNGMLDMQKAASLITHKTKLVSIVHVSNALGTHNPIGDIIAMAHAVDAMVLIDACQSVAHQPIDVTKMDCDFLVFSGHKLLAPTGVGVLYIKKDLHEHMPPYQVGGGMVEEVDFKQADWREAPYKFQAGTQSIEQAVALGVAIDYIKENINWADLRAHESALTAALIDGLQAIPSVTILGPVDQLKKVGHMVSFIVKDMHAHDVAAYLDKFGICVRAGHHCAQPLAKKWDMTHLLELVFMLIIRSMK